MQLPTPFLEHRAQLSVCVPTCNRADLLSRTLRSVAPGCPPDVEIIVSDNSANNDSLELCARLLGTSSARHRYIKNEPAVGVVENHNLCLHRATGEWVLILHDDDYLLPGAIDILLEATRNAGSSCNAILFGVEVVDAEGRALKRQVHARKKYLPPRQALLTVLSNSSFVRVPAIVVRRHTYLEEGGFALDVGTAEDFEMWCRIFARHGVQCMPQVTSAYTVHTQTLTSGMFARTTLNELQRIFERMTTLGFVDPATARNCQRAFFHQFILGGAYRQIRQGNLASARRILELFTLPEVRQLGVCARWAVVRAAFALITLGAGRQAVSSCRQ